MIPIQIECIVDIVLYDRLPPTPSIIHVKDPQRHRMSDQQPRQPNNRVHEQQLIREPVFPQRSSPYKPQIQDREVRCRGDAVGVRVDRDCQELQLSQQVEDSG